MITGAQIKAAREQLKWSANELARRCRLAASTVHRAECVHGEPPITNAHAAIIRQALERAGVEFDDAGVRVSPKPKAKT